MPASLAGFGAFSGRIGYLGNGKATIALQYLKRRGVQPARKFDGHHVGRIVAVGPETRKAKRGRLIPSGRCNLGRVGNARDALL